MMDSLKVHVTSHALQVMIQAGHRPLARPPYSPWLAPIKFIFGPMEAHLRCMQYSITKQNFRRCIIAAFREGTTPANRCAVFDQCSL
jgi:transposase